MSDWLLDGVRRRCLRGVGAAIFLFAVAVAAVVWQRRYVQNFFGGPYRFGVAELNAIDDLSTAPRYFVAVRGAEAIDTGIRAVTIHRRGGVETSRSTGASYYLLPVGDRFLLCKSGAGVREGYEGELTPIPARLEEAVFGTPENAAMRDRAYPYYLDDGSFRVPGVVGIVALLGVIFLLAKHGVPAWKYLNDPSSHPLVARAKSWPDPVGTAAAAQQEAGAARYRGGGGWRVTDRFLIQSSFFSFDILRLTDLLWAYKKVTRHFVNFIPTRKTYEAILVCYGGTAVIPAPAEAAQLILAFAAERAPWARFGYTDDLAADFKRDARAFAAAVEKRRGGGRDVEGTIDLTSAEAAAGIRRTIRAPDGSILEVKIPAGVKSGSVLRLVGKGRPAPSGEGPAGNLYIIVRVRPDSI